MGYYKSQYEYGLKIADKAAERWGVTRKQAIKIILDVKYIKDQWTWVNIQDCLHFILEDEDKL